MSALFRRVIKAGFLNFKRGGLISFASVLVMTITLAVITSLILLHAVLQNSLIQIKDKVDVSIYFVPGAEEEKINSLKESIENLPEVADVTYSTEMEVLESFKKRHESDAATLSALEEIDSNPFGASLDVRAKEISQYESIANFLKSDNALVVGSLNIIDEINYNKNKEVIDKLDSITKGAERLGFLITILLICISVIITFNTIRLTMFIAREEIGIMRLVGASKMRIRGPFMVEGMIYGVISAFLSLILFLPATSWIGKNMTSFLDINIYEYYVSNIFQIFSITLISGILLGVASSLIAIRRYLNK